MNRTGEGTPNQKKRKKRNGMGIEMASRAQARIIAGTWIGIANENQIKIINRNKNRIELCSETIFASPNLTAESLRD
jgi:hypothetical protein